MNISKINLKGTNYDIKDKLVRDSIGVASSDTSLGIAPLDASGKVPSENLPSYVDDVIEGYYNNGAFYEESAHTTLISGETGKIYVDLGANKTYRWSGSLYIVITDGVIGKDGATWFTGTYFNFRSGYANTPYNLASQNGFGEAKPGDFYLNTSNGDVYKFIEASGTTNKLVGYLCNIKGANGSNGANGTDGITPSISATATVNNSTGTPSVTVTKSGTDANPSFAFAFSNIKGDPGNAGVTGVKGSSESSYRTGNVNITPANIGLGNVGNFKAVSTVVNQGLTDTEKSNARTNIGAGTSSFSGSYNDLTDKPTIPTIPASLPANGGNADTVDGYHADAFAKLQTGNDLIQHSNEFNFVPSGYSGSIYINYRTVGGTDGNITDYILGTGDGRELGTVLHTDNWSNFITIPTTLPASDVYSWAKASTKPSYTASEVGISSSVQPITSNTSSSCSITGSGNDGKNQTIIYTNSTSSDLTVTVPTIYKTPDGAAIELTCKAGGYCEVNYLNIDGTIYARGL